LTFRALCFLYWSYLAIRTLELFFPCSDALFMFLVEYLQAVVFLCFSNHDLMIFVIRHNQKQRTGKIKAYIVSFHIIKQWQI
jgi:hypothetical protein